MRFPDPGVCDLSGDAPSQIIKLLGTVRPGIDRTLPVVIRHLSRELQDSSTLRLIRRSQVFGADAERFLHRHSRRGPRNGQIIEKPAKKRSELALGMRRFVPPNVGDHLQHLFPVQVSGSAAVEQ